MTARKLLAVFAHPDDETFGTGGTLAYYAQQGVEVYLICATRGEVGEAPADLKGFASVAEMREDELRCAAKILGLKAVYLLGYRDSGMPGSEDNRHPLALAAQPLGQVALQVARFIRELQPQVVITFDPIGGYRHPDHIAIQRATVEAFRMAGDPQVALDTLPPFTSQRLYFATFSRRYLRAAVRLMRLLRRDPAHMGVNQDIDFTALVSVEFPIHAAIPVRRVARLKEQAAACHGSQIGGLPPLFRSLQRFVAGDETFMRAVPPEPPPTILHDLFEGVV